MKNDIILAGVGGQGILTIAASIGLAALAQELILKQAEVHGMSQRGGAVQSHLRLSDQEVHSDLIPLGKADLILSVEPMESLRYLPYLSKEGYVVTNSTPYINIPDYPGMDDIIREIEKQSNHLVINADQIAKDIGSARSSNMVMLGAGSPFIDLHAESFEKGIGQIFKRKGEEVIEINVKAFYAGRDFALNSLNN